MAGDGTAVPPAARRIRGAQRMGAAHAAVQRGAGGVGSAAHAAPPGRGAASRTDQPVFTLAAIGETVGRKLMDAARYRTLLMAALAAPGVVIALLTGVSGISAFVADRPLILAPVPRNAAEAAGNRDVADLLIMSMAIDINAPAEARIPLRLHEPNV